MYYAAVKLKLPSYLKNLTLNELIKAGATVDPDISITSKTEDFLRKRSHLIEKMVEIHEKHRSRIIAYYANARKHIPADLLRKMMHELTDDERASLGIQAPNKRKN